MRSPHKGSLDVDHGLSLLPAGHHRVEIDIETDQVLGYAQAEELRSSSSPSQRDGIPAYASGLKAGSHDSSSAAHSPGLQDKHFGPIEDPFWGGRETPDTPPFVGSLRPPCDQHVSSRAVDELGRSTALVPHLGRNGSTGEIPFQRGEELPDASGLHITRHVVTHIEQEK